MHQTRKLELFYSPSCPHCEELLEDEEFQQFEPELDIINTEENREYTEENNILSVPTLLTDTGPVSGKNAILDYLYQLYY